MTAIPSGASGCSTRQRWTRNRRPSSHSKLVSASGPAPSGASDAVICQTPTNASSSSRFGPFSTVIALDDLCSGRNSSLVSLTQYYTATSLDGFIADSSNSLDWLFTRAREEGGPLDYGAFIAEVGALAMGSTTYEWILDHEFAGKDPAEWKWPYDVPCWVFTHRRLPVVPDAPVEFP